MELILTAKQMKILNAKIEMVKYYCFLFGSSKNKQIKKSYWHKHVNFGIFIAADVSYYVSSNFCNSSFAT